MYFFKCLLLTFKMMSLLEDLINLYCNLVGFIIFSLLLSCQHNFQRRMMMPPVCSGSQMYFA